MSIAKKKPGFKANYLLLKKNSDKTKYLKKIFFGQENNYEEVLINDYQLIEDTMYYKSYNFNFMKSFSNSIPIYFLFVRMHDTPVVPLPLKASSTKSPSSLAAKINLSNKERGF